MLLLIGAAILLLDQISKFYVRLLIPVGDSVPVIQGFLRLTRVENPGAAWGILPNRQLVFVLVSLAIITFVFIFYRQFSARHPIVLLALGLQLGGSTGNLVDRVATGHVTDFLDFQVWPVFNVADSAIVVGAFLLLGAVFLDRKQVGRVDSTAEHLGGMPTPPTSRLEE